MTDIVERIVVDADELADHWGLTHRRIKELAREGVIVKAGAGYDLRESDRRYITKLRSNDESRRLKSALIARQTQRQEVRLHQDTATLMTRAEAEQQCEAWWGYAWTAVQGAIARLYYDLPGDTAARTSVCYRISNDIQGELHLHRERIKDAFLAPDTPRSLDEQLQILGITVVDTE